MVTEGLRSIERQRILHRSKKTQTMQSKHLVGEAIDVAAFVDGQVNWDFENYKKIASAFKAAAKEQGIKITWGGDWRSLRDGPHFELRT